MLASSRAYDNSRAYTYNSRAYTDNSRAYITEQQQSMYIQEGNSRACTTIEHTEGRTRAVSREGAEGGQGAGRLGVERRDGRFVLVWREGGDLHVPGSRAEAL